LDNRFQFPYLSSIYSVLNVLNIIRFFSIN
jgi:hypothetical protein